MNNLFAVVGAVCGLCFSAVQLVAATEYVSVVKVMQNDDKGIIQRKNGERWMIEKGVGAISFWRYEGKTVLVQSPGTFCGVGSKLILPDESQEARIWNAEMLSGEAGPSVPADTKAPDVSQAETAKAIARSLVLLKYFDSTSSDESKRDPIRAVRKLQAENSVDESGRIGPRTLAKIAELLLREKVADAETLPLVSVLIESAKNIDKKPLLKQPAAPAPESSAESFIVAVSSDGSIVKLADGSVYEIEILGQIKTILWLPAQRIQKQRNGLLNLQNGQLVKGAAIK